MKKKSMRKPITINLPNWLTFKKDMEAGKTGRWLVKQLKATNAGRVMIKARLKDEPYCLSMMAKKIEPRKR